MVYRAFSILSLLVSGAAAGVQVPLSFQPANDSEGASPRFVSRGDGSVLGLSASEIVFRAPGIQLRMAFAGANGAARLEGLDGMPGRTNYLCGPDPRNWRIGVPNFGKVVYRSLYPGVDLYVYGRDRLFEYDFVLAPGADPNAIRFTFDGHRAMRIDAQGSLVIDTAKGAVRHRKPVVFQETAGGRRKVDGAYRIEGPKQAGFRIRDYDPALPLTIDPVLSFSTYLGGGSIDAAFDTATDSEGNVYITGGTGSRNFPVTEGVLQPSIAGVIGLGIDEEDFFIELGDAFVTKLDRTGKLVYSTYLGGKESDIGMSIAVDSSGNAYVTGITASPDFPTTPGSFQPKFQGGKPFMEEIPVMLLADAYVAKLSPDGSSLVYSGFLGGAGNEWPTSIAVDADGNAFVTGATSSTNFPVTPGAAQPAYAGEGLLGEDVPLTIGDAFVAKISAAGDAIAYATYLGGSSADIAVDIAVDSSGGACAAGTTWSGNFPTTGAAPQTGFRGEKDAFFTCLNAAGTRFDFSTFWGGSRSDEGYGVAIGKDGGLFLVGRTRSADITVTPGAYQDRLSRVDDVFAVKFSGFGEAAIYATYLGGDGNDNPYRAAVDGDGNLWIAGETRSRDFPTTPDALRKSWSGSGDIFLTKLNANATTLLYSTYFGGRGDDKAFGLSLDPSGAVNLTGITVSEDFQTTTGAPQGIGAGFYDAFVIRVSESGTFPMGIASRVDLLRSDSAVSRRAKAKTWRNLFRALK